MSDCNKLGCRDARRFLRRAHRFDEPVQSVAEILAHHGYVQMDPLNVCGRMHDLILRNRVVGYRENDLIRHLHVLPDSGNRVAFEHYLPGAGILVAFPLDAWPHLIAGTQSRRHLRGVYSGRLSAAEEQLARRILGELADRGALTSDQIEDDARARTAWNSRARMVKTVLEKLFIHGRVFIARRAGYRRVYDLPERVLPAAVLGAAVPSAAETRRWLLELRLRQRRLAVVRKAELPDVADLVMPVPIADLPSLYCLRADAALWDESAAASIRGDAALAPRLLAPLDPLIYDRTLTRRLWDFDYTWEVYTPAAKRQRGYYALPVLSGLDLVGHVEPKADRANGKLTVVSRRVRRGHAIAPAVRELARFLGLAGRSGIGTYLTGSGR